MALNSQIFLYSVDTSSFYNDKEMMFHRYLSRQYNIRKDIIKRKTKNQKLDNMPFVERLDKFISNLNKKIKNTKAMLYKEFDKNITVRELREPSMNKYNIISMFDSSLTRIIGAKKNTVIKDILVVQTYFFEVLEQLILNGFMYKNEKYCCFTASAGQIRTKKTVFIKEDVLKKHINTITCGLTIEEINKHGGININKYLAYLALCNSATDKWENYSSDINDIKDFDITKTIVIPDMETDVKGIVDFMDDKTYSIKRRPDKIPIAHTDGCGMMLLSKSKKSMMVRLPWVKGLLVPFPFDKFIREKNKETGVNCGIVKDIYGKEHDILKEKIEIIFTQSQFKMYKFYNNTLDTEGNILESGWDLYIRYFLEFECQVGKCNEEEDIFSHAKLNYQMLQTLTTISDTDLRTLCKKTKNNITRIGKDRKTMLKVLGVVDSNTNKNYVQQALEIYPELLNDTYSKEILKQVKKSLVKAGRSGKLDLGGTGVYTFLIPDLYAFCEYTFLKEDDPKGLLDDKYVYCALYKDSPKLDCLRSPHLYKEHAVRNNVVDKERGRWFVTNGLYTSCKDLISKVLMFDNDGDKSLIWSDKVAIKVAESNMENIVPLYYNMAKAEAVLITNENIYAGLKSAYTGGNIGLYSNNISKIFNSDNINLEAIKLLCMENNFTIDFAKTLYKPKRPKDKQKLISAYTNAKVPNFFIYAKDKDKHKVEEINTSTVNKLQKIIPNPNINFKGLKLGEFDYKMLMKNNAIEIDNEIVSKYTKLDLKKHFMINSNDEECNNIVFLYQDIKKQILEINDDIDYVTDVLVKYLYVEKNSSFKTTLWECFGEIIVNNLKNNIPNSLDNGFMLCEICGERIEVTNNKTKYCKTCADKIKVQQDRIADKKYKERKKSEKIEKSLNIVGITSV